MRAKKSYLYFCQEILHIFPITLEPLQIEQNLGHIWNQWPQIILAKCQNHENREKILK